MTWNMNGGKLKPAALASHAKEAIEAVGLVDVLVLQEVVSKGQVSAIARVLGMNHYVISDFSPPTRITGSWSDSLEVAILSQIPMNRVAEWDTTGRQPRGDNHPPKVSARSVHSQELSIAQELGEDRPPRGFLRADLEGGWSVYAVHWKSSRGESCNTRDLANARQREQQAAGLAEDAAQALRRGRTVVVAGDFNVQAPGRVPRAGTDPNEDCKPTGSCAGVCGTDGKDGYDDSIQQLVSLDSTARLLSAELPHTYIEQFFPGGAIDHILVAGPAASGFAPAVTVKVSGDSWFGSDHRPVIASVTVGAGGL